ncbi:DUF2238 domain-containing protein [archaeon]|nr:DUF2238 domain-containing protein [archaeon]
MKINKNKYPKFLLFVFLIIWILLAINPWYRNVWFYENIPTVIFTLFFVLTYNKFKFSNFSYTLIFIFLVLHTLGSHYSYTHIPLYSFIQNLFDLSRNSYDRIVHFLFGFVFVIPSYEFISRKLKVKKFWAYLLALFAIAALHSYYEVIEMIVIVMTNNESLWLNYFGTQGDVWDPQKDMFVGFIGSLLAGLILLIKNRRR